MLWIHTIGNLSWKTLVKFYKKNFVYQHLNYGNEMIKVSINFITVLDCVDKKRINSQVFLTEKVNYNIDFTHTKINIK